LQTQGLRSGLHFNWGVLQQQLDFFPRVRYKNILVSLAQWKINVKSMETVIKQKDKIDLLQEIEVWRTKTGLPRYVLLVDGDNTLFVDLENKNSVQAFLSLLSNRNQIILEEFIEENNPLTKDLSGRFFTNECIVPFYNAKK
jgi:hypothetical protein